MEQNIVRPVDSITVSSISHFSDCEVSSMVRINTVCNNMAIGKIWMMALPEALYKKRQILNRLSIYSSKDKVLSFSTEKVLQDIQPVTRSLVGHYGDWYHIWESLFISADYISDTQQQL